MYRTQTSEEGPHVVADLSGSWSWCMPALFGLFVCWAITFLYCMPLFLLGCGEPCRLCAGRQQQHHAAPGYRAMYVLLVCCRCCSSHPARAFARALHWVVGRRGGRLAQWGRSLHPWRLLLHGASCTARRRCSLLETALDSGPQPVHWTSWHTTSLLWAHPWHPG